MEDVAGEVVVRAAVGASQFGSVAEKRPTMQSPRVQVAFRTTRVSLDGLKAAMKGHVASRAPTPVAPNASGTRSVRRLGLSLFI